MKGRATWRLAEGVSLEAALSTLQSSSIETLRRQWQRVFGTPAPRALRQEMLVRALSFELQAAHSGGLASRVERRLRSAGETPPAIAAKTLKAGARLVRDWQGQSHHVLVLDSGFDYQGQHYASLSEVARHITGTRWSGPRFFGLTQRASDVALS